VSLVLTIEEKLEISTAVPDRGSENNEALPILLD